MLPDGTISHCILYVKIPTLTVIGPLSLLCSSCMRCHSKSVRCASVLKLDVIKGTFKCNVEFFSRSSACLNLNNYLVFLRVMGIQAVALLAHCNYVLASVFLCRAAWKEVQFYTVRKDLP